MLHQRTASKLHSVVRSRVLSQHRNSGHRDPAKAEILNVAAERVYGAKHRPVVGHHNQVAPVLRQPTTKATAQAPYNQTYLAVPSQEVQVQVHHPVKPKLPPLHLANLAAANSTQTITEESPEELVPPLVRRSASNRAGGTYTPAHDSEYFDCQEFYLPDYQVIVHRSDSVSSNGSSRSSRSSRSGGGYSSRVSISGFTPEPTGAGHPVGRPRSGSSSSRSSFGSSTSSSTSTGRSSARPLSRADERRQNPLRLFINTKKNLF